MFSNHIEKHADKIHKCLILGIVSMSLLGTLSGCKLHDESAQIKHTNLKRVLTTHSFSSPSLCKLTSDNSDVGFDNTICLGSNSDNLAFSKYGKIGYAKEAKPSPTHHDFKYSSDQNVSDASDSDLSSDSDSDNSSDFDVEKMRYKINSKHQYLFIYETPENDATNGDLKAICYKFYNMSSSLRNLFSISITSYKPSYTFIPCQLKRVGDKHYHYIPKQIAKRHKIQLIVVSKLKEYHHTAIRKKHGKYSFNRVK